MNNKIMLIILVSLLVGCICGYVLAVMPIVNQEHSATSSGMHRMADGTFMANQDTTSDIGMMDGMDHTMMMVSSEKEFLTHMIPHHLEAVDTAKEVLARGATTPEIKALVEGIITAQEKEITAMKSWYEAWYGTAYVSDDSYKAMMRDLSELRGVDIDKVFLEDMMIHHMGAIMMAKSIEPHIEHPEIEALSKAIISSQSAEIQLMKQLRGEL